MTVSVDAVMGLNFAVDFLLLLAANRLCGFPGKACRCAAAAALGAVYAGVCVVPGFYFLGNTLWRIVFLGLMAVIAFGFRVSALRRGIIFVFLSMALGGIALELNGKGAVSLLLAACGVWLMCVFGFRGRVKDAEYVSVKLRYGGKNKSIIALKDTGNTLKDPISGEPVLVVGADVAYKLLGLTQKQLANPIETVERAAAPGLRLIPYRAVGQPGGMLLAARLDEVIIGKEKAGTLVAFAPQELGRNEGYQALAGGTL